MSKEQDNIRHSLAHLLAAAVKKKYPRAQLGVGPVIENGFYYDFGNVDIAEKDLESFEKEMRVLIEKGLSFKKELWSSAEAEKHYKKEKQPFKLELIKDLKKEKKGARLGMVWTGDVFLDLCRGGHVKNTKEINPDAFKLTRVAGAYWKGDEKNPMLTRVYGVAFDKKKELEEYLWSQEEARKRDHKKLGPELDLFTFSELIGPGLPLFTPKGTILRDVLDTFVWELRKEQGYQRVDIPHITKKDLYVTSGHWDKFKDELFKITTREGHEFALKPMNCPHHIQIFNRKAWSFRDLPQRYASTTKTYRDEQTGELAGLSRVRSITMDDAHVFCRLDQIEEEITTIWGIVQKFYSAFDFDLHLRLSLRDPKNAKAYLGEAKVWKEAESVLEKIAQKQGADYEKAEGEAAFYGPKLDFMTVDSLGREWQVATIQLDLNMPRRFEITYTGEGGKQEDVYIIHAAIMGSIERFLSILIEHYGGAFPLWVAPEQVWVIPVSEKYVAYAKEVKEKLEKEAPDLRLSLREENESLGKKIREGETMKIPYLLIVGEKEEKAKAVSPRKRGEGDLGALKVEAFITRVVKELEKKQ